MRVLIGAAFGVQSPVATFAPTLYLDIQLPAGGQFTLPPLARERALYAVDGDVAVDGATVAAHTLGLLQEGATASVTAGAATRMMVIGGDPLDGPRHIWWNFVSSRKDRIVQAASDWEALRADAGMGQVPGETESIPLPERRFLAG